MAERPTHTEVVLKLDQLIVEKTTWLESFSAGRKKYPDHIIARKREDLFFLRHIRANYSAAADRERSLT